MGIKNGIVDVVIQVIAEPNEVLRHNNQGYIPNARSRCLPSLGEYTCARVALSIVVDEHLVAVLRASKHQA